MIIDKLLQVSDDQVVTATAPSTDVIDFGHTNPNVGLAASNLTMVVTVAEAATAAGAATVTFEIQDSADGSSWNTIGTSGGVTKANLGAGAIIPVAMPAVTRRYLRVNYTVGTGPLTGGKFSAQIVAGYSMYPIYPAV